LAIIASLWGFLFGYDTAVISGTIKFYVPELDAWFLTPSISIMM
jgi:hypothetical protein